MKLLLLLAVALITDALGFDSLHDGGSCVATNVGTSPFCGFFYSHPDFHACLSALSPPHCPDCAKVVFPDDPEYEFARSVPLSRYAYRHPAAVVYAHTPDHVSAAVLCGFRWGVRVSTAGGRHSYQGTAIQDGALVIDVSNLTLAELAPDNMTIKLGAGMKNAQVAKAIHDANLPRTGAIVGNCASVGISGLYLGGGMSELSGAYGLACDNVVEVDYVLYNGTQVTASKDQHPDLFWASCGGGGGLGVVTSWTVKLAPLPDDRITTFLVLYFNDGDPELDANGSALMQHFYESADRTRFPGGAFFCNGTGLQSFCTTAGAYLGPWEAAYAGLKAGGLLDEAASGVMLHPGLPSSANVAAEAPNGVVLREFKNFSEYLLNSFFAYACREPYLGSWQAQYGSDPDLACGPVTSSGDPANVVEFPEATQAKLWALAGDKTSPLVTGDSIVWEGPGLNFNRLVGPLPRDAWKELAEARYAAAAANNTCVDGVFVRANHVSGGAVSAVGPEETAFYFRGKTVGPLVVQRKDGPLAPGQELAPGFWDDCLALAGDFLRTLAKYTGEDAQASYTNYGNADALWGWQYGYFGKNYPRLQAVKAMYDPIGLFDKPMTVQGNPVGFPST